MPRPSNGLVALAAALAAASAAAQPPNACSARSGAHASAVVELYTSEGCDSCPPADRWLSRLKDRSDVVALAFHVDYWDRLGWVDRFASPEHTRRQSAQMRVNGARFPYTPQVVVDGVDRTDWPGLEIAADRPVAVAVALARDGDRVQAAVTPQRPGRFAAYWAVTESGHRSDVKAGENRGVTLHHDFVVRALQPVPAWEATAGASHALAFDVPAAAGPQARRINLVVLDAAGRPVQALALDC